jgi:hypothetical protein
MAPVLEIRKDGVISWSHGPKALVGQHGKPEATRQPSQSSLKFEGTLSVSQNGAFELPIHQIDHIFPLAAIHVVMEVTHYMLFHQGWTC